MSTGPADPLPALPVGSPTPAPAPTTTPTSIEVVAAPSPRPVSYGGSPAPAVPARAPGTNPPSGSTARPVTTRRPSGAAIPSPPLGPDGLPLPVSPIVAAAVAELRLPTDPPADETDRAPLRAPLLRPLLRLPLKKISIWAGLLLLLWALRDFFPVILLTFVLSYITSSVVRKVAPHFTSRRTPVVLVFLVLSAAIGLLGTVIVLRAVGEGKDLADRFGKIRDPKAFIDVKVATALGRQPKVEAFAAVQGGMFAAEFLDPARRGEKPGPLAELADRASQPEVGHAIAGWLKEQKDVLVTKAREVVGTVVGTVIKAVFTVLFSLLFSFMIVLDMPKLALGVRRLERSRLGDVWIEVAPSIATFARLLGRAFEAQTAIATLNTFLTFVGMSILGIEQKGFLSIVVFLCSFIPIIGVFASTVPICLVALQSDGGVGLMIGVVVMVIAVHSIEAYVLNPRIYGHHMKLHPLAVLMVLYLAEHMLGVWGLVTAVPLATYVWRHLVLGEVERVDELVPAPAPTVGGRSST